MQPLKNFFAAFHDYNSGPQGQKSSKRLTLVLSAVTLCGIAVLIGSSVSFRITNFGDVGTGAVAAFLAVTGPLAALAGVAYKKADTTASGPSIPEGPKEPEPPAPPA